MEQHRLIKWLKFLVIFAAGCGMVMDLGVLPGVGSWMVDLAPEFGGYFWPWLIFLWILSVPCYMALWMAWKIFTDIEKDKAFTMENAKRMGNVSFLAAADAVLLIGCCWLHFLLHWWELPLPSRRPCCPISSGKRRGCRMRATGPYRRMRSCQLLSISMSCWRNGR